MFKPFVSIVLAAKNASGTIGKCLASLQSLQYSDFEIIVVNDGSSDDTALILKSYPGIKNITTAGVGRSLARNLGVQAAKGDFIAFTDADCIVDRNWLNALLEEFISDDSGAVGGIQRSPADETWFGKKVHRFLSACSFFTNYVQSFPGPREVTHNPSCNVMYRKSAFDKVRGFSTDLQAGEDPELDYRLRCEGYRLHFNPRAIVYHYRVKTLERFWAMMHLYGCAQSELVKKHGVFRPVQWVPFFTLSGIILLVTGALTQPLLTVIAIIVLAGALWVWLSFDPVLLFLGSIAFIAWHTGYFEIFFKNRK
jgi:glycosyltransferase involved in cell wall biosynthesis